MCLTIPGKVTAIKGEFATVDYGAQGFRDANITMVKVKVGDHVLVQGGFVIKVLSEREARDASKAWEIIQAELDEVDSGMI